LVGTAAGDLNEPSDSRKDRLVAVVLVSGCGDFKRGAIEYVRVVLMPTP
jgi:hypothetical protein